MELFTDASSTKGFGGYFKGEWFYSSWPSNIAYPDKTFSMAFLELYPIVVSAILWGSQWTTKRILFWCDNEATVAIVKKGRSKCLQIMKLMRKLTWCAYRQIPQTSSQCSTTSNEVPKQLRCNVVLNQAVNELWNSAIANTTRTVYDTGFRKFETFMLLNGFQFSNLPPISEDILIYFIAHCFKILSLQYSTIKLYLCGIRIGAATSAGKAKIEDHLIKTLGRWTSDSYIRYIRVTPASIKTAQSRIQEFAPPSQAVLEVTTLPICPSISVLVAIEAILNPTNDIQPFVEQISVTEKLMKLTRPYLYSELIRACFMGLIDANEKDNELNWAAFTYLKLPQVVVKMNQQAPRNDFSTDIEQGIDLLLNSVPLLDLTDIKLNCDCVQFLLLEFTKHDLITESQSQRLLHRRSTESEKPAKASDVATKPTPSLIIKAEPTVGSILKTLHTNVSALNSSSANTLDADCSKNQEALISVLCHMLSGKSFDLIIAAAAANGTLQNFAVKLVKINEYAKQVQQTQGESSKAAQNRALLFDISFLMLCHITQLYGSEIVTTAPDFFDTFFYQWATQCLPEDSKYKCIDNHTPTEQNKVDQLLGNLLKSHELNYIMTRWQEMCTNMPFVAQEILFAWEHGALSPDYVKAMVNRSKSKMLCLPIIMSTWLCSYMNTVGEESREKPLKMLQFLKNINPTEGEVHFTERSHLMSNILRKIVNDILPVNMKDKTNQHIPLKLLPCEVLDKCLKNLFSKGWIDMQSVYTLEQLLNLCGGDWFSDRTVMCMLEGSRLEDLNKALSIVYAIFYMDLEPLTLSLILHTIPKFLQTSQHTNLLTDPRGYILAKLCVMCITSAQTAKTAEKDIMSHLRRGRKRSRKEIELDEMEEPECRPVKRSKTMEPQLTLDAEGFNFVNMFRLMNAISQERSVGPQISFIVSFIEEAIKCGPQYSRGILQFMPPQMLSQIMRNMPAVFTNQQILHICDLSTLTGRKWAAKAVCQNARYKHDYINIDRNS
ncbi:mediator of RNA polymerase II transcription subunit 24 [Mytilus galloprovincialis]|uniref:Mediator of RNA polymerase II transcription subunit 24 n=1 Tax=Mytilus galloprovincialis TaxID=29158 RepID=A0A8B6CBL6_MYTGA|nr:mediator of RNA polymerase II transcription subunit 24 [Mytilus galloprovincialis]